jgi:ribosomal protein S18 acetylase RimI-like enzyme
LAALAEAPDAFGTTFEEASRWPGERWLQQLRDLPTFIAADDVEDLGIVRGEPDHDDPTAYWLMSMWVAPSARGRGVGDALVQTLVAFARERRATRLVLDVADHNTHAIALYERHGFVANGQHGAMPPPREHVREHQLELRLANG